MIPASFGYVRPDSAGAVTAVLAEYGTDAAPLAGGQTLLTQLKLRSRTPRLVVDLAGVPGLDSIAVGQDAITFGAMARQAEIVSLAPVVERLPLLARVADAAADPMVRRRGTIVGACCAAEPGGDWLAAALALDGTVVLSGVDGERESSLTDFVLGPARTDVRVGEFVRSLRVPVPAGRTVAAYRKFKHVAVGWSAASAAIVLTADEAGRVTAARIAVSGAPTFPQRLGELEAAVPALDLTARQQVDDAIDAGLSAVDWQGDYFASPEYRRKRLAILLRRTLMELGPPLRLPSAA